MREIAWPEAIFLCLFIGGWLRYAWAQSFGWRLYNCAVIALIALIPLVDVTWVDVVAVSGAIVCLTDPRVYPMKGSNR